MIAAAPGTIAKLREAKKMEGSRGGAGGSARQESWHSIQRPYATLVPVLGPTWPMDPRIFLLWKKRIRLRFFALQGRDIGASGTKVGNARVATGCTPKPVASHRRPPAMKGQMQTCDTRTPLLRLAFCLNDARLT